VSADEPDAIEEIEKEIAPIDEPDLWDRTAGWIARHGALPLVGVLTLAMAMIYARVFRGEPIGDDLTFHLAESARLADCLRAGDWDFWNPSANAGFASAYYYQVIPQLASAIPAALFGHHLFWFQLTVFLPLVLTPGAAYRGMRLLGAVPWQAAIAALALAVTIGSSRWGFGADGTFSVGLYTQTWALAAFPLALGHAVRWATQRRGLGAAVAWSAFVGLCHPFAVIALGVALLFGYVGQVAMYGGDLALASLAARLSAVRTTPLTQALRSRWRPPAPPDHAAMFARLAVFAILLALSQLPTLLPLVVDYDGFGGFPHRVKDEIGPGFETLWEWFVEGKILDHGRPVLLTALLPFVLVFVRAPFLRWLWAPAVTYALLLGLGPHLGKTGDDLLPAIRFLGAMQIVLALALGAGVYTLGKELWNVTETDARAQVMRVAMWGTVVIGGPALAVYLVWFAPADSWVVWLAHMLSLRSIEDVPVLRTLGAIVLTLGAAALAIPVWRELATPFGLRTGLAASAAALVVATAVPTAQAQMRRVRVLADDRGSRRHEMLPIISVLSIAPPGRKQVGPGCVNHWWNLLSYVYGRVPSLLQMGGGGLQASPNYDFLWTVRDFAKNAWIYDAPYLVFDKSKGRSMPDGELVFETDAYLVRRLRSPGLVSPIQITGVLPPGGTRARSAARNAALAWAQSDAPLANQHLAYAGHGEAGPPPQGTVRRAWRQDSPGDAADLVAEVDVTATTTFVFRESWHPRWRAYVDGAGVPVRRVTPDFPAVDVPAGPHTLELRFERPWWVHAAWLAWPGAILLGWLAARPLSRAPRGAPVR